MAGIEATTQQIGRIDPSSLVGLASPVVEPRATQALTDAFRNGVVTASDIVDRFGEVGKSADAAKVMQAQEAVSPEAQVARAAQTQQATVAAQQQTRRAQFPGTAIFDALAPGSGVEFPVLPDGTPDVQKENQIGTHLAAWDSIRKNAQAEEKALIQHFDKDRNVMLWLEPGGGPVDPARLAEIKKTARMTFQGYVSEKFPGIANSFFPGAGQVAEVTPTVAPIEVTPESRAGLARKFGADSIATMSDADVSRLYQSEQSTPPAVEARPAAVAVAKPEVQFAGQPVGGGFALGPAPVTEVKIKSTAEQDKAKLAMTRFAESNDMLADLEKRGYNPANFSSSTARLLPEFAMTEEGKLFNSAKSAWVQGILRLESGAAIAKQEQKWYETSFFPQVNDTPKVQEVKANLRHGVEQMVSEIARLGGETPETKAVADRLFQQAKVIGELSGLKTKETTGVTAKGVVELPGGGQAKRNAQGIYTRIK